jgi:hypothetical protein
VLPACSVYNLSAHFYAATVYINSNNALGLCSRGIRFESQPRRRLSWLRTVMYSPGPPCKFRVNIWTRQRLNSSSSHIRHPIIQHCIMGHIERFEKTSPEKKTQKFERNVSYFHCKRKHVDGTLSYMYSEFHKCRAYGWIILKWILGKGDCMIWTGLFWRRIATSVTSLSSWATGSFSGRAHAQFHEIS